MKPIFTDLETERLILKNISPDDRDFIFRQFSDEAVCRFLFDAEPLTEIGGADKIIESYLQPEPRTHCRWILIEKNGGEKIGTCGFHRWNAWESYCEAGYDLFPDFWGRGYMTEAMREAIRFARAEMLIKTIGAVIYPDNLKSVRLAEKLGFVHKGETKDEIFRGETYEHKIYTLDIKERVK